MTDDALEDQLRHRVEDGIAWLTLNRPDAGNAVTPAVRDRMIDLLDEASADVAVRVVVIGAEGRHFPSRKILPLSPVFPSLIN